MLSMPASLCASRTASMVSLDSIDGGRPASLFNLSFREDSLAAHADIFQDLDSLDFSRFGEDRESDDGVL